MNNKPVLIFLVAILGTVPSFGAVRAEQAAPNLAGTYRCEPDPSPCRSGETFMVTQTGNQLEFKSNSGAMGHAMLTSNISLIGVSPWNSLGIITSNNRVIEWSNGTKWSKG